MADLHVHVHLPAMNASEGAQKEYHHNILLNIVQKAEQAIVNANATGFIPFVESVVHTVEHLFDHDNASANSTEKL